MGVYAGGWATRGDNSACSSLGYCLSTPVISPDRHEGTIAPSVERRRSSVSFRECAGGFGRLLRYCSWEVRREVPCRI